MSELQNLPFPVVFLAGLILGALIMLLINKLRSGSVAPTNYKQQMEDYQEQVEEHFEETSKKFKDMTRQYQDLYQHLSEGATTLCRPEHMAIGLADQSGPLASIENQPEAATESVDDPEVEADEESATTDAENNNPSEPAEAEEIAEATATDDTVTQDEPESESEKEAKV